MSKKNTLFLSLLCFLSMVVGTYASFIDMDTPFEYRTTKSLVDGSEYYLVMSDEFEVANRSFADGHDPLWTALDKPDAYATSQGAAALHFYNSSTVTTKDGYMTITTKNQRTAWSYYDYVQKKWVPQVRYFTSGMMQTWNKFCFTGGIVEIDVIFPGEPYIGGLWPAVWLLGNLGRATYEGSTNNMWPWSYNVCNRDLQLAQTISACNKVNYFELNPYQGRGATEIDLVEVMTGPKGGPIPATDPPIELPYADMTLQIAPGVPNNRPQPGAQPLRHDEISANGATEFLAQTWYEGMVTGGNTSMNPYFYGEYLAATKPNQPALRSRLQAYQADAISAMHQLTPSNFRTKHKFRLEWQPGPGGRIDWFSQGYKVGNESFLGNGLGTDWIHNLYLKDSSFRDLMGSQIPAEPSSLIVNVAVSPTWGFPYNPPYWCPACYDCNNPGCECRFYPGFCNMINDGVEFKIDSVRVYQTNNASAHVGDNHTLGCDPPGYPTAAWIAGNNELYMRQPPFGYNDPGPLRPIAYGGGKCHSDADCGADIKHNNLTKAYLLMQLPNATEKEIDTILSNYTGRGYCKTKNKILPSKNNKGFCKCYSGYAGPHCLAQAGFYTVPSAYKIQEKKSLLKHYANLLVTPFMAVILILSVPLLCVMLYYQVIFKKRSRVTLKDGIHQALVHQAVDTKEASRPA